MSELKIYNSLSGKKEVFKPIHKDFVGLYVCGPTVYSHVHLGNCRTFISFDLVYRYLNFLGYKVRYVRNITDAGHLENDADSGEDKISKKARLEQIEPMEVVQKYTLDFHEMMSKFNNLPPSIEPTATAHIIEQIEMVKEIMNQGLAYEVNGSVYFDVEKYNKQYNYGELSGRKIEDLISGTRDLDGQEEKRNSLDFALWKNASPTHIMKWPSPWGVGFPGWHLECSAMSTKYLGEQFDIHGGGMDLKFPHHECEVAQGIAANKGKSPVKYWMHGNMLTLNGKKMSKSAGNTLLPVDLFEGNHSSLSQGYHPIVVRFFILQAHYRSTLDFTDEALKASQKGYQKLMSYFHMIDEIEPSEASSFEITKLTDSFYQAMNDDFNSPVLIAQLFEACRYIYDLKEKTATLTQSDLEEFKKIFKAFIEDVLGLYPLEEKSTNSSGYVEELMQLIIDIRARARENKDWEISDIIRDRLLKSGIQIKDEKEGSRFEFISK